MLELYGVAKSYTPGSAALAGVDLAVGAGEIVCLLGPSGCGKTTLLRVVAGLEQPDAGRILLDGADLASTPVHERGFGLMFQEFVLFPHRTVGENVAFGLRMAGRPRVEIERRVDEMLALVDLAGYGGRSIFELSGGERQRVALARSLAPSPRLLMLDEPLGSLDRSLREALMTEVRAILKAVGVTALYVTHDHEEAFAVSDRLAVMEEGRIAQVGTPQEIYLRPASAFVARFLGFRNLLPVQPDAGYTGLLESTLDSLLNSSDGPPGETRTLLIRPQAAHLFSEPAAGTLRAVVQSISFRGDHYQLVVAAGKAPGPLVFQVPTLGPQTAVGAGRRADPAGLRPGTVVYLHIDPALTLVLSPEWEEK